MLKQMSSSPRSLSREEQEELARSNKKVKDVKYAGFREEPGSGPSSPNHGQGAWNGSVTFRDKLIGEIPGAFTQAFSFGELMEDDADSDEEVDNLRAGLVAIKFSKDLKQRIRTPWSKALIVKVYGRAVGLNFLHNRLLSLWKPAGRLDCVDLEHGFFLTRFSLKDDFETVLNKGPWFIGEHFLSIRPWEPNFHPATANVTSIAVWIRLNALPIEYYNPEALLHIGKSIGNVLRVDSHTAMETRGRFARICVQIDVDKPLVTAVLIGKFEQPICYEGLQSLCFSCGRIGHRKENCPYTIRTESSPRVLETEVNGISDDHPCNERAPDNVRVEVEPNKIMHEKAHEEVQAGTYGPWTFVTRRKNGTKFQGSGGTHSVLENSRLKHELKKNVNEARFSNGMGMFKFGDGPTREAKRKLTPQKASYEAHMANAALSVGQNAAPQAQVSTKQSPYKIEVGNALGGVEAGVMSSKSSLKASVKGKKALARARAHKEVLQGAAGGCQASYTPIQSVNQLQQTSSFHIENDGKPEQRGKGKSHSRTPSELHSSTMPWPEVGFMFRGTCGGDAKYCPNGDPMEDHVSMVQDKEGRADSSGSSLVCSDESVVGTCVLADYGGSAVADYGCSAVVGAYVATDKDVQASGFNTGSGNGCALTQPDVVTRGGTEQGDAEIVRMDFEGGGQGDAFC